MELYDKPLKRDPNIVGHFLVSSVEEKKPWYRERFVCVLMCVFCEDKVGQRGGGRGAGGGGEQDCLLLGGQDHGPK